MSETALMQSLMVEYDALRDSSQALQAWSENNFHLNRKSAFVGGRNHKVGERTIDEHRFRISRFFVKVRKLAEAGFLAEDIIVAALDQSAIRFFLQCVDPLDETAPGYTDVDAEYFSSLLDRRYKGSADGGKGKL